MRVSTCLCTSGLFVQKACGRCLHAHTLSQLVWLRNSARKTPNDTTQALCPGFPFSPSPPPPQSFSNFSLPPSLLPCCSNVYLSGSTTFYFLAETFQFIFSQWDTLRSKSLNINTKVFLEKKAIIIKRFQNIFEYRRPSTWQINI